MRKLELAIKTVAAAFGVPEATVRSRWQILRKGGLWSKVGPGRDMPDPSWSDLTNMLLSLSAGGLATKAAETTRFVRGSRPRPPGWHWIHELGEEPGPCPVAGLADLPTNVPLGDTLDDLIGLWSQNGKIEFDALAWERHWQKRCSGRAPARVLERDRTIKGLRLTVRETWLGWYTKLHLETVFFGEDEDLRYQSAECFGNYEVLRPELVGLFDDGREADFTKWRSTGVRDDVREHTITHRTFAAVAACLNGDAQAAEAALGADLFFREWPLNRDHPLWRRQ